MFVEGGGGTCGAIRKGTGRRGWGFQGVCAQGRGGEKSH